jgi:hypothetical protein
MRQIKNVSFYLVKVAEKRIQSPRLKRIDNPFAAPDCGPENPRKLVF